MRLRTVTIGIFLLVILILIALPLPKSLRGFEPRESLKLYDRNGILLYASTRSTEGSRSTIDYRDIPKVFITALVATEDRQFFHHFGLNPRGIARAFWQNIRSGRVVAGGSSLTQQTVRNVLKPASRGVFYKLKEAFLALKMEQFQTKEHILTTYVNTAYFGHQAYGLQAASRTYFGKNPSELSTAEIAFLVGLLQSPSALDPFDHFADAKRRQELVLQSLQDVGFLTPSQRQELSKQSIALRADRTLIKAPHFVMWLLQEYPQWTGAVYTTLDEPLQEDVERIIAHHLKLLTDHNVTSAAVVVIDAKTGDLLSMVGSADYFDVKNEGAVNVALSARQPGSAIKPFTYALALSQGDTAASTVEDIETQFFTQEGNPYVPRNYDYGYHGLVRYREALANSYNIAAVKVLERVGVARLVHFLRDLGISSLTESPEHYGLALTLGDSEVELLELAQAYGAFARGGRTLNVRRLQGELVDSGQQVMDERVAWLISNILSDNQARLAEFGPSSPLALDFPVAAKTGTSRNARDNWTLGYTPQRIVGVWVGNPDNTPMHDVSGITGAGPIFHDVMVAAMRDVQPESFAKPEGITEKRICRLSGKLPTVYCLATASEFFVNGTEPKEPDTLYRPVQLDKRNLLLATDQCDASSIIEKVFVIFPPSLRTWARENGWPSPPTRVSPLCPASQTKESRSSQSEQGIAIVMPHDRATFLLDPLIPDDREKIILQAAAADSVKSVEWFVNGKSIGFGHQPNFRLEWKPEVGNISIEARAGELIDYIRIEVQK